MANLKREWNGCRLSIFGKWKNWEKKITMEKYYLKSNSKKNQKKQCLINFLKLFVNEGHTTNN